MWKNKGTSLMPILKVDIRIVRLNFLMFNSMVLKIEIFFQVLYGQKYPKAAMVAYEENRGSDFSSTYVGHHKSLKTRIQNLPIVNDTLNK